METRKRKTNVTIWSLIVILLISVCLILSDTPVAAETMKYRVSAYLTDIGFIPVGDTEGHIVGHYTRRGLAFFENGEVATYTHWGTFDFTKGIGPYIGYSIFTYEDGSTIVQKIQGPFEWAPGRKMRVFTGMGEFIKGTGRFEGIKGTVSFSGKEVTPSSKETKSDIYFDNTATYTLPPKWPLIEMEETPQFQTDKGYSLISWLREGINWSKITITGKALPPYGPETKSDAYFDVIATYTLPPKWFLGIRMTGESATAYHGDILFKKATPP